MASKGRRYSEEQVIRLLKEVESGTAVAEACRKYGVSEQAVYRWGNKYGGLETSELQRLPLPIMLVSHSTWYRTWG